MLQDILLPFVSMQSFAAMDICRCRLAWLTLIHDNTPYLYKYIMAPTCTEVQECTYSVSVNGTVNYFIIISTSVKNCISWYIYIYIYIYIYTIILLKVHICKAH